MSKANKNAISPTRSEDYPQWYQQVIKAAELAENSQVRGCMVIKPWGYGIWENMQRILDGKLKETGHVNAYFPLFIPLSFLEKEAKHVEGFAKECAVVTHHRLEATEDGGLKPAAPLEEPLVVRPTSETIIGDTYSRWVSSYRDLPILINQWANVVRWEMRPRLFLRTAEFLWQEGHTVHATQQEAEEETAKMLEVYRWFAEEVLAMPVIPGEKTEDERFPGAVKTFTIEALMQDKKALQAGTSHFLGQNFAKAQNIKFLSDQGNQEFAWTTSWGVSTRLVGGVVMTHGDDDGLKIPPRIAPKQVVVLPVLRKGADNDEVIKAANKLADEISNCTAFGESVRVECDTRDLGGGEKSWQWIKRGVPIRLELGPRDIEKNAVFMARRDRDLKDKASMPRGEFLSQLGGMLEDMQKNMFKVAKDFVTENTHTMQSKDDLEDFFSAKKSKQDGFVIVPVQPSKIDLDFLKSHKLSVRCIPLAQDAVKSACIFSGEKAQTHVIIARAY